MGQQIENKMLKKVECLIANSKDEIASRLGCVPLFGAIAGSWSLNLANEKSDIDIYMITQDVPEKTLQSIEINNLGKVDCTCVALDEVIEACEDYVKCEHRYPTRFFRGEKETLAITKNVGRERPDFKREIVMRIFIAEKIFEFQKGAIHKNYEKLKSGLLLIDVWDAYFNRAYGNYIESIKNNQIVLLRKYLHTISEIMICYQIIDRTEKVDMNFVYTFTAPLHYSVDEEIAGIFNKLWDKNKRESLPKTKATIISDEKLNSWIETNLEELLDKMRVDEPYLRTSYLWSVIS